MLYRMECNARETRMKFYRTFCEPKLYKYARSLEYDKIVERCQKHPNAAKREARFRHSYAPNQTPLHLVLEPYFLFGKEAIVVSIESDEAMVQALFESRHEAAASLVRLYPEAALDVCSMGTTPLIMVCLDPYANIKDLNLLLEACPKAALVADMQSRLPLHYACLNNRCRVDLVEKLLSSCPEAATIPDRSGRLALHYACMASPIFDVGGSSAKYLEGVIVSKLEDETPQKELLQEKQSKPPRILFPTVQVLEQLIAINKNSIQTVDKEGRTPLHYICLYIDKHIHEMSPEVSRLVHILVQAAAASELGAVQLVRMEDCDKYQPLNTLQTWFQRIEDSTLQRLDEQSEASKGTAATVASSSSSSRALSYEEERQGQEILDIWREIMKICTS